jgi:hypothetical protein
MFLGSKASLLQPSTGFFSEKDRAKKYNPPVKAIPKFVQNQESSLWDPAMLKSK